MQSFEEYTDRIRRGYAEIGHTHGWRFLYGPRATFRQAPGLVVVGLNPGGSDFKPEMASVEAGNAYNIEFWSAKGGYNALQKQVHALFHRIADLTDETPVQMMDETLTVNYCPFRSANWASLHNKNKTVCFCDGLWADILGWMWPKAVLCVGLSTSRNMARVLHSVGWQRTEFESHAIQWHGLKAEICGFARDGHTLLLVAVPHLSTYQFIARPESQGAVSAIATSIADAVRC